MIHLHEIDNSLKMNAARRWLHNKYTITRFAPSLSIGYINIFGYPKNSTKKVESVIACWSQASWDVVINEYERYG